MLVGGMMHKYCFPQPCTTLAKACFGISTTNFQDGGGGRILCLVVRADYYKNTPSGNCIGDFVLWKDQASF